MSLPVIFLCGKGGVGKTTCALALGRALSREGPVTVVSLDPAHNLGDVAGVALGRRPRRITGDLRGWEPDLEALGRERTDRTVQLLSRAHGHLDALSLGGLPGLLRHAPGLVEQAALDALLEVAGDAGDHRKVVVDMPPTGLASRMLALPALQMKWIDVLSGLRGRILDRRAAIAHVRGPDAMQGDGEGAAVPADAAGDAVYGELVRQKDATSSTERLVGSGALHILVVHPEPVSIAEAGRLLPVLRQIRAGPPLLLVNRCRPDGGGTRAVLGDLADLRRVEIGEMASPSDPSSLDETGRRILEMI